MVWLGVGTTLVVGGCLIYYALSARNRTEEKKRHPVVQLSQGWDVTETAKATITEVNNPVLRGPDNAQSTITTEPPTFAVTPSNATVSQIASTVQKDPQHNGVPVAPSITPPQPPTITPTEPPRLKPPTFSSMAPPSRPTNGSALRPPPSAASMLRVPPTKMLSNTAMAPSSLAPSASKPSRKVILKPGHSPLDWAMLISKPNHKLRGKDVPDNFIRVPPSMLKYHNGRKGRDVWTEYQGKVYNVTPYLPFHPGGEGELMRGAGKDSAKLFMEVHPWVNWEGILGECLIGILVSESEAAQNAVANDNSLEEMD